MRLRSVGAVALALTFALIASIGMTLFIQAPKHSLVSSEQSSDDTRRVHGVNGHDSPEDDGGKETVLRVEDADAPAVPAPLPPANELSSQRTVGREEPDNEWAAEMENAIWAALQDTNHEFTSIELVKCSAPTCEIRLTGRAPVGSVIGEEWEQLPLELMRGVGFGDDGMPIIKQMSFGPLELRSGSRTLVVFLSTEPADQPRASTTN